MGLGRARRRRGDRRRTRRAGESIRGRPAHHRGACSRSAGRACRAARPGSSTSRARLPWTPRAGSTSPIPATTASRCSTPTAPSCASGAACVSWTLRKGASADGDGPVQRAVGHRGGPGWQRLRLRHLEPPHPEVHQRGQVRQGVGRFRLHRRRVGAGEPASTARAPSCIGRDGNVYVMDTGNKRVQVFTPDGGFITQWGGGGVVDGRFDEPVGLAQDADGNWYVADTWNKRIQKFSEAFNYLAQWPSTAGPANRWSTSRRWPWIRRARRLRRRSGELPGAGVRHRRRVQGDLGPLRQRRPVVHPAHRHRGRRRMARSTSPTATRTGSWFSRRSNRRRFLNRGALEGLPSRVPLSQVISLPGLPL